jgi:hypothetical protein
MFEVIINSRSVNHFHEPYVSYGRKALSQFVPTVRICRIVNRLTSRTNGTIRKTVGRSGQQASAIGDHLKRLLN